MNLKILDTSFLVKGIVYFRPFIRGFLVLLMLFYHIRQLIGFFGLNSGEVAGKAGDDAPLLPNESVKTSRWSR